jgi:hypothetical protein
MTVLMKLHFHLLLKQKAADLAAFLILTEWINHFYIESSPASANQQASMRKHQALAQVV